MDASFFIVNSAAALPTARYRSSAGALAGQSCWVLGRDPASGLFETLVVKGRYAGCVIQAMASELSLAPDFVTSVARR